MLVSSERGAVPHHSLLFDVHDALLHLLCPQALTGSASTTKRRELRGPQDSEELQILPTLRSMMMMMTRSRIKTMGPTGMPTSKLKRARRRRDMTMTEREKWTKTSSDVVSVQFTWPKH